MYKLVDTTYAANDEPTITVVSLGDNSGLEKLAADSRIQEFVAALEPQPGKVYLHINAMGAGEFYGANRNADYFPEENLKQYYKTFETSPAHLFRNHVNKNPEIANGKVIFAIYNERMHRVELIAEADQELITDIERRISVGDFPATSMACRTPYDVCSICGNKAHTRQEYCSHLRNQLGQTLSDGRKVMALNVGPLRFFDISIVIRPADITSSILQKVAQDFESGVVGSAELAEIENLTEVEKRADHSKISELLKLIDGGEVLTSLKPILDKVKDPSVESIKALREVPFKEAIHGLAAAGISPSIEYLAELLAQHRAGDDAIGSGEVAASLVRELGLHDLDLGILHSVNLEGRPHPHVAGILAREEDASSLDFASVEKRAFMTITSPGTGYTPETNRITPHIMQQVHAELGSEPAAKESMVGLLKALIGIGASAILAKWAITRYIKSKQEEAFRSGLAHQVKIPLSKQAQDASLTLDLAKAAMISEARPKTNHAEKAQSKFIGFVAKMLRRSSYKPAQAVGTVAGNAMKIDSIAKKLNNQ